MKKCSYAVIYFRFCICIFRMSPQSSLADLPDEILLQVMSYLTTSDLLLLAR